MLENKKREIKFNVWIKHKLLGHVEDMMPITCVMSEMLYCN